MRLTAASRQRPASDRGDHQVEEIGKTVAVLALAPGLEVLQQLVRPEDGKAGDDHGDQERADQPDLAEREGHDGEGRYGVASTSSAERMPR